jgi:hypothetical protein
MKVKVLRAFLLRGEVQPVDAVIDVPDPFGIEMLFIGKVARVPGEPVERVLAPNTAAQANPPKKPMTTANTPLVAGKTVKKEKS